MFNVLIDSFREGHVRSMQQQWGKITDDIEKYEKVASDFRKTGNPEFFKRF